MTQQYDSEKTIIENSILYLEETVDLFKSVNKPKMESWIANEFLSNLGISFTESELIHSETEPPDIIFRGASFEIKRKYDEDRKPDEEFKRALNKARSAEKVEELFETYPPTNINYTELLKLIELEVGKYSEKYTSEVKSQIDLLLYVELFNSRAYIKKPLLSSEILIASGFRSVSFVAGSLSGILHVTKEAPEFLCFGRYSCCSKRRQSRNSLTSNQTVVFKSCYETFY